MSSPSLARSGTSSHLGSTTRLAAVSGPARPGAGFVQRVAVSELDDWRRVVANRFVTLHVNAETPEFHASLETVSIDDMHANLIQAPAHSVHRLASAIHPDEPKHLKLSLQLEGAGIVEQDGRSARLSTGDVAVYDTSRPYRLEFTRPIRSMVLVFPHELLGLSQDVVRRATAMRLRGDEGIGTVIIPFMRHLAMNLDLLVGVNGVRIMHSALGLVTALLSSELAEHDEVHDDTYRADMDKYRLYIEAHLGDSELSTESIARAHFLSTRYLQYLFREEGTTVSDYIRARRLDRCRLALLDPAQASLSILQIAQRWGFVDGAHFSRVFKAAYGTSPREYRQTHQSADQAG